MSAIKRETYLLRLAFGLFVTTSLVCYLYASICARGLYADAGPELVVIYQRQWFFTSISGYRAVVEVLRQAPIVLLSKYTAATLLQCGQVFTFVMLSVPMLLLALCWPVAPQNNKAWILFPLAAFLIGFPPTAMNAVGESAIATFYFWILLFLILFRTKSVQQQAFFILICIPAFWLHEGAFLLTLTLLLALVLRVHAAAETSSEWPFVALASLVLLSLFTYQIRGVIIPQYPGDRAHIVYGLTHFEFAYADHRLNLPIITGVLAFLSLSAVCCARATMPSKRASGFTRIIPIAWILVVLVAITAAIAIEASFSPLAQAQSRYHPVFVSAALAAIMILFRRFRIPHRIWNNPATILILISLCVAQAVSDVEATRQWNVYITDLKSTLTRERGLIPWETRLSVANRFANVDWPAFEIAWTIPFMCIIFAPGGIVNAMIDLPKDLTFRPLDPERLDRLPKLAGIDYEPYKRFVTEEGNALR